MSKTTTTVESVALAPNPRNEILGIIKRSFDSTEMRNALPKHLTPERILRFAATALSRSPDLLKCSPMSVAGCFVQASQIGLDMDPTLGHAYAVPFKNRKTGDLEATFIPGYKGLVQLAYRSGQVERIDGSVVFKADEFRYVKGTEEHLHHVPTETGDRSKDSIRGAYVLCWTKGSRHPLVHYMPLQDIEKRRLRSPGKDYGPWANDEDYVPMCLKTVARDAFKFWPVGLEAQRAAGWDEQREAGVAGMSSADFAASGLREAIVDVEAAPEAPKKKSKIDALKESTAPAPVTPPGGPNEPEPERTLPADGGLFPKPESSKKRSSTADERTVFEDARKSAMKALSDSGLIGKGRNPSIAILTYIEDADPTLDFTAVYGRVRAESADAEECARATKALQKAEEAIIQKAVEAARP